MTERPILMSAPMIRAILAGTKTQTRRVVKPVGNDGGFVLQDYGRGWWPYRSDDGESPMKGDNEIPHACPYGRPGDQLWVREAFSGSIAYERHGYPLKEWGNKLWYWADGNPERGDWTRPRPSIHMPRHLSRITLEVTGVRIERLQAISRGDAMAEGCPFANMAAGPDPRDWYRDLWDQINGPGAWDANPWVWVVEFKRVKP